jgi:hypothetical protein
MLQFERSTLMLINDGLTFREIVMKDPMPIGVIQQSVVDFLKHRQDAAIYGAMAVNAYTDERRMTEDVDIISARAKAFAEELRQHLGEQLHIAVRVRSVREEIGFRLYQVLKPKNRHLVDVRSVDVMPAIQLIDEVPVLTPAEVIAGKVISCVRRKGKPKSFTDRRDLAHMLLRFPELKTEGGMVEQRLESLRASEEAMALWRQLVAEEILAEEDDDEFS